MREKIENMDLIYGVTISNIMDNYAVFKTLNNKKLKEICLMINETIKWLYNYPEVNSINITLVTNNLFEEENIQNEVLNLNFEQLKLKILEALKKIDFKKVNKQIKKEKFLYIEFVLSENFNTNDIDFYKEQVYAHNLLYSDLIMLLLNNYDFGKKTLPSTNWKINFLNVLNLLFYQVDIFINSTREDLYYIVLQILEFLTIKSLLFPTRLAHSFEYENTTFTIKRLIYSSIFNCLHKLNNIYYIEIPEYNYNNSRRFLNTHDETSEIKTGNKIYKKFNSIQKMFILKNGSYDNHISSNTTEKEIENFIDSISDNKLFIIYSQNTDKENKELIEDSIEFIQDYCKKSNLKLFDFVYTPNFDNLSSTVFVEFYIKYNNYKYKFILAKYNLSYTWKVILKNKKIYKINCYLKDDFKHLVQAMFEDNKR